MKIGSRQKFQKPKKSKLLEQPMKFQETFREPGKIFKFLNSLKIDLQEVKEA